jgi:hypothetical protein
MLFYSTNSQYWVDSVTGTISSLAFLGAFGIEVWAFVHILLQRGDAFTALGTATKPMWLLLIGGCAVFAWFLGPFGFLLSLVALVAALVYLLDVRPAIREITGGH